LIIVYWKIPYLTIKNCTNLVCTTCGCPLSVTRRYHTNDKKEDTHRQMLHYFSSSSSIKLSEQSGSILYHRSIIMPSLDGISKPSLAGIKQASSSAFNKAQLMVGLKKEEDLEAQQQTSQAESLQRQRPSFVDEAADLLCPELTFQQVCPFLLSQNIEQTGISGSNVLRGRKLTILHEMVLILYILLSSASHRIRSMFYFWV
jgi:hypothetical protein